MRRAALETALTLPAVASTKPGQFYTNRLLRSEKAENRQIVFEVVRARPALADNLEIVSVVSEALNAKDDTVRREALALVQKYPSMGKNPAVRLALKALLDDPAERTRQLAEQLYNGKESKVQGDVTKMPDITNITNGWMAEVKSLGEYLRGEGPGQLAGYVDAANRTSTAGKSWSTDPWNVPIWLRFFWLGAADPQYKDWFGVIVANNTGVITYKLWKRGQSSPEEAPAPVPAALAA